MGFSTYSKCYNSCVAPILEYCSGVWGGSKLTNIEFIQNRAIRTFLGVHKFAPNAGIIGEVGWDTCTDRIRLNMIRLWNRIIDMDVNRWEKHIFMWDYEMGGTGWCNAIRQVFLRCNLEYVYLNKVEVNINMFHKQLQRISKEEWKINVENKPKLRTYKLIKDIPDCEPYVKGNLSFSERSFIAQLRLGILPLNIETGRFVNKPLQERKCCNCQVLEDESHFLFYCQLYNNERRSLYHKISYREVGFLILSETGKFKLLCNKYFRFLAQYITKSWAIRQNMLYN